MVQILNEKIRRNFLFFIFIFFFLIPCHLTKQNSQKTVVEEVSDVKDFKKILRTKNNVLVCFTVSIKQASPIIRTFKEAAEQIKGQGTMVLIDCSGEAKKMCKKLKIAPDPYVLKHYKDGDYHKDYDRRETVQSMVNFMRDPTGDLPWEEDSTAEHIVHISDAMILAKFLKKELKPILVMFYAPWCGFCKQLKPEFAAAATELKGHSVLAAIDVNRPENAVVRQLYNISGFPTLLYYENGHLKHTYDGENKKDAIVKFMKDPHQPTEKQKEVDWSEIESDVVHLTAANFDTYLKEESSVLVMFYAPWCGHCKRMKPEYMTAAARLKDENIPGKLAAVDATKEAGVSSKFNIRGYPTVKYFKDSEFLFDVNLRDADKIVEFMQHPKEPPPPPPPEKPWSEEESEVVHLTEETFKPFLKKKKHVLVMFYAPWCGHCKKAKPEFKAAAERFKDDPKVEFAAIDCTAHTSLCSVNEVRGYPTIKYYHYYNKEVKSYNGGRTESEFVSFMEDPQNPLGGMLPPTPSPEQEWSQLIGAEHLNHLTDKTFDTFAASQESMLVMFYAPWCGHCKAMKADYAMAAQQLKDQDVNGVLATVDATAQTTLQERFEIRGFPTLKYFKKGHFVADYDKKRKADDILSFMKTPPIKKDEL